MRYRNLIKISFLFIFFSILININAQPNLFGNEWLAQTGSKASSGNYVAIKVAQDGIYRVSYQELIDAGFSVSSSNPQFFQLWRRGVQQSIIVQGETDGSFDSGDFVEFYGVKNDGVLDTELFNNPLHHASKYYNFYSDTAVYFLTAGNTLGLRTAQLNGSSTSYDAFVTEQKQERLRLFNSKYWYGRYYISYKGIDYTPSSFGDQGEGWFSGNIGATWNWNFTDLNDVKAASTEMAQIEFVLVGTRKGASHSVLFSYKTPSQAAFTLIDDTIKFSDFQHVKKVFNVPASSLRDASNSGILNMRFRNLLNAEVACAYVKISFPQETKLKLTQEKLEITTSNSLINAEIGNSNASSFVYEITNQGSFRKILPEFVGASNTIRMKIPNLHGTEQFLVSDNYLTAPKIKIANFPIIDASVDFLLVTHDRLLSSANEYKAYRESMQGGSYKVQVVTTEQLYNEFSYGEYTPVAIRRYCNYMLNNGNPKFLFLVGNGFINTYSNSARGYTDDSYSFGGVAYRKRTTQIVNVNRFGVQTTLEDLVPTAGMPGSDVWFTARLLPTTENSWAPTIPTGRISALTNEEVINYLEKIKEHEQLPDTTLWKKNILHLAGGYTDLEISIIYPAVERWKLVAEGQYYGAKVSTISRPKNNNPTTISNINIADQVNNGLHLVTFFGHSSATQSDIDIGEASNPLNEYNNKGKYPLMLLNGCSSGDCFTNIKTWSEDWTNVANRGAIGYIGISDVGFTNYLDTYTARFYTAMFQDTNLIDKPIGVQIQSAIRGGTNGAQITPYVTHVLEMVYQGDPALRLTKIDAPDLAIDNNSIFLDPINENKVTAVSEEFNLGIIVKNYGWYSPLDSFFVSVTRDYNGIFVEYPPVKYGPVKNLDTIYFKIESKDINTFGLNGFNVHIDYNLDSAKVYGASIAYNGEIKEIHENNNEAYFQYYMPLSAVFPLYPTKFSIVNLQNYPVNFIAQSTDLITQSLEYLLELDTTKQFNSPVKRTITTTGSFIAEWNDVFLPFLKDTTVFYWRVRFKNLNPAEDTIWGESSFTFIAPSSEGWSQAHYYQFLEDKFENIELNTNREWTFDKFNSNINIITNSKSYIQNIHKLTYNNQDIFWQASCYNVTGVRLIVIDPYSLALKRVPGFDAYVNNCEFTPGGTAAHYHYYFNLDNATHANAFKNLMNTIPDCYYVALSSMRYPKFATWATNHGIEAIFSQFGATNYPMQDTIAYTFVGRRNCPQYTPIEVVSSDTISINVPIYSYKKDGNITSTIIGPATAWDKFLRSVTKIDNSDKFSFDVYGINLNSDKKLLYEDFPSNSTDISIINSDSFPFLQLQMKLEDEYFRTPPQLNNWLIIYESKIPEGTFVTQGYNYENKEYYQGENLSYTFKFKNYKEYDFAEPLIVRYAIASPKEFLIVKWDTLEGILKSGEEVEFKFEYSTLEMQGEKQLQVFVNPRIQIEQYYTNNLLSIPFSVKSDDINPLMDVVFDGVHIMDGDIISPNPKITIRMKDENKHVPQNMDNFEVFWKKPNQSVFEIIELKNNPLIDTLDSKNGQFTINYSPINLQDGLHTLSVQVADAFGNKSGSMRYEIAFEVINESSVTHFYPYPNPFSTRTQFAYTLTGSQQPTEFKIQIMTLSGKMVREITKSEIGILRIGKHLTDYAWDGTDEFGDKLANGVYLYRVVAKIDGEEIKNRVANSSRDAETFHKNWGKLYILR